MDKMDLVNQIYDGVKKFYDEKEAGRVKNKASNKTKIPLNVPTYNHDEVIESLDSLFSTNVTMGKKVYQFEKLFAEYIGTKYSTMVNSGSSANLIALSILTNPLVPKPIMRGEEIITPAVTWSTTIFPIAQVGAIPVIVDVGMDSYTISVDEIEKSITPKTRAIMPVHLLGNPCAMKQIMEIAEKHNLFVIEDTCESHGAKLDGKKVGSFGDFSTFSFFFSHHISTIEGGMVLTNNEEFSEISKSLRAHGWVREMDHKDKFINKYPSFDPRFLFVNYGYNLRPTDLQGGFGIHQIKKMEHFLGIRIKNADYWSKNLEKYNQYLLIHHTRPSTRHAWYGYPITIKPNSPFSRKDLTSFLESRGIETRPLMSGNIIDQPAMQHITHRKGKLPNAEYISSNSFFFGNHHWVEDEEREYLVSCFEDFFKKYL